MFKFSRSLLVIAALSLPALAQAAPGSPEPTKAPVAKHAMKDKTKAKHKDGVLPAVHHATKKGESGNAASPSVAAPSTATPAPSPPK